MRLNQKAIVISLMLASIFGAASVAAQAARPSDESIILGLRGDTLRVPLNKGTLLTMRRPISAVSVANPEIADVTVVGGSSVLLTAKKAGNTQLIVWDEQRHTQVVEVVVAGDLAVLQDQLNAAFPGSKIEVSGTAGTVILRGTVNDVKSADQAQQIAAPFGKVMDFLEVPGGQQVMLQVRFAEVSKTATAQLGVNFSASDGVMSFGSNVGQVNPVGQVPAGNLPANTITPAVTLFGSGKIGSVQFEAFLNALRQNSLMRVLAEPNVTVDSGQEANLVAGGEIPVPVTQGGSGSGGPAITVEYKEFGIKLHVTPVVLGQGKIRMKVNPEVSDLDYTNGVTSAGFVIPGISKRTVSTTVELTEGQTFAIGGLLSNRVTASKDVIPVLGDLPFIGALFRSVRYQRQETELVVLVTPRLVEPMNPDQVPPVPGEHWRSPTENELFWMGDLGGPAEENDRKLATATPGGPPKFRGPYGFNPPEAK